MLTCWCRSLDSMSSHIDWASWLHHGEQEKNTSSKVTRTECQVVPEAISRARHKINGNLLRNQQTKINLTSNLIASAPTLINNWSVVFSISQSLVTPRWWVFRQRLFLPPDSLWWVVDRYSSSWPLFLALLVECLFNEKQQHQCKLFRALSIDYCLVKGK